ncbi:MAG: tetratricopeptide repeat protein, partial [Bacteroidota bacterium]
DLDNFGKLHPTVAVRQSNLANVYGDLGRYEEAAKLLEAALQSDLDNFGKLHPTVAIRYNNLAWVKLEQEQYQVAVEYFVQAYTIFQEQLGAKHPNSRTVLNSLNQALQKGATAGDDYCREMLAKMEE